MSNFVSNSAFRNDSSPMAKPVGKENRPSLSLSRKKPQDTSAISSKCAWLSVNRASVIGYVGQVCPSEH